MKKLHHDGVAGEMGEIAMDLFYQLQEPGTDKDGVSEEDKRIVARARKIERFLSQPFHVAEAFTGQAGQYVEIKDTVRGFKEIIEGRCDDIPEQAFVMMGGIESVRARAEKMAKES